MLALEGGLSGRVDGERGVSSGRIGVAISRIFGLMKEASAGKSGWTGRKWNGSSG